MLQVPKLTLKTAIDCERASEMTRQLKTMAPTEEKENLPLTELENFILTQKLQILWPKPPKRQKQMPSLWKNLPLLLKKNHFESMRMAKKNQVKENLESKKVNLCDESENSDSRNEYIATVNLNMVNAATINSHDDTKLFTNMHIQQKTTILNQYRATVNVIGKSQVPSKCTIEPTTTMLKVYNNTTLTVEGKTRIPMKNLKNNRKYSVACMVVNDEKVQPILGLHAAKQMNVITDNTENIAAISGQSVKQLVTLEDITYRYPSLFDGELGLIKDNVILETDPTVQPVQNAIRHVPHALMASLKSEIDRLKKLEVTESVNTPTELLSNLVTVKKPTGEIRVCIDPQTLSTALKWAPVLTPVRDALPQLEGSKIFTVIDVKSGHWNRRLLPNASQLTTTSTPSGNICFLQLLSA